MKKVVCILFLAVIFGGLFVGCANSRKVDLPIRSYVFEESDEPVKPNVTLRKENEFSFSYSEISSYFPMGIYEIDNNNLILTANDDLNSKYIFEIKNGALIFNAEKSSEIPSFANVPNGAVFK